MFNHKWGGEYMSNKFEGYYKDNRIIHQYTMPYTPQHNQFLKEKNDCS